MTARVCLRSRRADGEHDWRFDGDDPYTVCTWCGLTTEALTGRVLREGLGAPQRVRMTRQRPWRADYPDAVIVARPSPWGNPARVGDVTPVWREKHGWPFKHTRATAVDAFRLYVDAAPAPFRRAIREQLAGRDLACWCPLDEPCHADVLLELANARADRGRP
ncbi:DUF4326 domain-containing protein [Cellulomonas sp.]|uniref:DUF4326 domain-containing protein n=1 Tax=Cellulomonas sp. TaxID=40001 RepID=UPI001B23AC84|nr:DUF4326 domain-containing protein [Cellulomonas sp.]MBO9555577.1 DUF4326 domain-containing protein [Cellulomonas sp.]